MVMDKLVEEYKVNVVEWGCAPGSGRYGLQIDLANDISAVFPYINAVVNDGYYDHGNHILIWRETDQVYALNFKEVRVGRIEDPLKAIHIANEIIAKINTVWLDRHNITPRFSERRLPTVIDLLKYLPKTNCRQCGYITCLAYAAELRTSQARLEDCLPLSEPKYTENDRKLRSILSSA